MSKDLDKATDSLSEQTKKFTIASYYTHGNSEKAKEMLSGIYKDLYAIKVKFSASSLYGAFLLFFSDPYSTLIDSYAIVSKSYTVDDIKTNINWKIFEKSIKDNFDKGDYEKEFTSKLEDEITQCFTMQMSTSQRATELKKYLELEDDIAINRLFNKFVVDRLGFYNIKISIDYELISSLDMELKSISNKKIDIKEINRIENEKKKSEVEREIDDDDEDEILKKEEIDLLLDGSLVLSPISGKHISNLDVGDKIKVVLNMNQKAINVAKAFKAYENEKILPLSMRIISIKHLSNGGYRIYGVLAKGIYVKINEEEDNINVAIEPSSSSEGKVERELSKSFLLIIVAIGIIVTAIILAIVL